MAKLQSTENISREMQQQSTEMLSRKRLCKRNRLFSGSWQTRQRRGVLLLVSLVLLVMFLMLGVTFVLTAGNFRRSSEAYQRMLERPSADLPERSGDLLDSVAHDLVRGTSSQDSPFSEENLLEDLYGRPALRGKVTSALGGQLKELTVTADADFTLSTVQDYYAGLVLTMLTGNLKGTSTRIVGWDGGNKLTVVAFPRSKNPANDDLFLVNGRPFSGDGSDTSGRQLNEDYDKADANNPWLASRDDSGEITSATASFAKQPDWNGDCRPVTITHDDGSTTQVVVDNDGDGEKDSVWIDAGLPLQLQPDGTYVKPLVAMMVRDLDGRVNLNAHGSIAQRSALDHENANNPLGQGYGPAEIDPFHALDICASSDGAEFEITNFLELRLSDAGMPAGGTTGDGTVPNDQNDPQDFSGYYQYGSEAAVVTPLDPHGKSYAEEGDDGSINLKTVEGGDLSNNFSGTTYDLELDTAQGVAPGWHAPYMPNDLERVLRFSDADADAIDSRLYEDLAACLSVTEIDPEKLKMIRERITTESWDLPVAGLGLPRELYSKVDNLINDLLLSDENKTKLQKFLLAGGHITDLLKARILLENPDYQNAPLQDKLNDLTDQNFDSDFPSVRVAIESFVAQLPGLGPGLTRGTRFNVNRLFGNGEDDDGNGVVDDVGEVGTEEIDAPGYENPNNPGGYELFDHDGNGTPGQPEDKRARQHYAQQLYLLLMLLADDLDTEVPADGASATDKKRILARRLAQFAVNAVDYRDPDSIMTGFEYDADPFDATGWDVDGDLSTDESNDGVDNDDDGTPDEIDGTEDPGSDRDRGVVWGCEDPVLYLTETYALHDRRVRDMNHTLSPPVATDLNYTTRKVDTASTGTNLQSFLTTAYPDGNFPASGNLPASDINNFLDNDKVVFEDKDFDQYAKPEGSLFVELYHARANPKVAGSKYALRQDIYTSAGEIDLGKVNASDSPVWRLAISVPHPTGPDVASTPNDETLYAGPGSPVFNQLFDVDGDGAVNAQEAVLGSASGFWSPSVTMQPGLPIVKDPSNTSSSPPAKDLTAKDKFNRQASPAGDDAIQLDRLVYFSPQAQIAGHVGLVRDAMQARENISGALIDANWDGIYCAGSAGSAQKLAEGAYSVVGPRSFTPFGREDDPSHPGQKTDNPNSNNGINLGANAILCTAASDSDIPLSVSEPLPQSSVSSYYTKNPNPAATNSKYSQPLDTPADNNQDWMKLLAVKRSVHYPSAAPMDSEDASRPSVEITNLPVTSNGTTRTYNLKDLETGSVRKPFVTHFQPGTIEQYCTVFLQRLANPLEAWNPETNPYISVDAMPVDLTVFNGDDDTPDPLDLEGDQASSIANLAGAFIEPILKNSRQRGSATNLLFPVAGVLPSGSLSEGANKLGTANFASQPATPAPFWPNRPYVSQYELLMVPASEPGKLALEMGTHLGDANSKKDNFAEGFPHLLNFFYNPPSSPIDAPQLGRVFDYLHVPSKYTGTQVSLDPDSVKNEPGFAPPFNVISTYREPGRVNLNTIEHEEIWDSVMNGMPDDTTAHQGPNYSTLSSHTLHGAGEVSSVDGTPLSMPLLRSALSFEGSSDTNPFLRYQPINRMGNLVTNRSNVYAVWMTLGFFETNKSGTLTDPPVEAGGSNLERHRAFYMIDRSIPVGYENGHDHNTQDVFRVKRYIE